MFGWMDSCISCTTTIQRLTPLLVPIQFVTVTLLQMSGGSPTLALSADDVQKMLAAKVHLGSKTATSK